VGNWRFIAATTPVCRRSNRLSPQQIPKRGGKKSVEAAGWKRSEAFSQEAEKRLSKNILSKFYPTGETGTGYFFAELA